MENLKIKDIIQDKLLIYLIFFGVIALYLPFISKQFTGDDWLWLANAKKALSNPELFFERPMYGYFRPLNMLLISALYKILGASASMFSMLNILLHAINVWLLWKVLDKFNLEENIRNLSAFIFGFYFLNASAIEWISVGHDLWVALLSFLFILRTLHFIEKPNIAVFIQILLFGIAATLFKESGFVTIGIFFLLLILKQQFPFSRRFRFYSLSILLVYFIYLVFYFITRTVADKEIVLGFDTVINLWYLLAYIVMPISKRVLQFFPENLHWVLIIIKISITLIIPLIFIYIFRKGGEAAKFFLMYSVMFLSTVAVFNWELSLFDLSPERTVSRFMYSAVPGYAVVLSWLWFNVFSHYLKFLRKKIIYLSLIIIFIAGNFLIINKISGIFIFHQKLSNNIISALNNVPDGLANCDAIVVLTDDIDNTHQIVKSGHHLESIVFVKFDRNVKVLLKEDKQYSLVDLTYDGNILTVGWQTSTSKLLIPTFK